MAPAIRSILPASAIILIAIASAFPADIATLESQLALARKADDSLARIELLRRIIDQSPDNAGARTPLIELWLAVEDYDMAEAALEAWPQAPAGLAARVKGEVLWHRDDNRSAAIKILSDHLATNPRDPDALADLSYYLGETGQWQAQIETLDKLLAIEPSADFLLDRALARRQSGAFADAVKDARAAQALDPGSEEVQNALPKYERLAQALERIAALNQRLKKNPRDLAALLLRAYYFQYGDVPERALQDAEAALALAPDSAYARIVKARCLFQLGKIDSAEARTTYSVIVGNPLEKDRTAAGIIDCDVALAADPKSAQQLQSRAWWLNEDGQFLLALADADAVLAIDPDFPDAALEGIHAAAMLGQADDATARLRALEAMQPPKETLAQAFGAVMEMYFRASNYPLALEFANRALALQETERLLKYKAQCLQRLGRQADADAAMKRANELQ